MLYTKIFRHTLRALINGLQIRSRNRRKKKGIKRKKKNRKKAQLCGNARCLCSVL